MFAPEPEPDSTLEVEAQVVVLHQVLEEDLVDPRLGTVDELLRELRLTGEGLDRDVRLPVVASVCWTAPRSACAADRGARHEPRDVDARAGGGAPWLFSELANGRPMRMTRSSTRSSARSAARSRRPAPSVLDRSTRFSTSDLTAVALQTLLGGEVAAPGVEQVQEKRRALVVALDTSAARC
jgi:hypothetical protein